MGDDMSVEALNESARLARRLSGASKGNAVLSRGEKRDPPVEKKSVPVDDKQRKKEEWEREKKRKRDEEEAAKKKEDADKAKAAKAAVPAIKIETTESTPALRPGAIRKTSTPRTVPEEAPLEVSHSKDEPVQALKPGAIRKASADDTKEVPVSPRKAEPVPALKPGAIRKASADDAKEVPVSPRKVEPVPALKPGGIRKASADDAKEVPVSPRKTEKKEEGKLGPGAIGKAKSPPASPRKADPPQSPRKVEQPSDGLKPGAIKKTITPRETDTGGGLRPGKIGGGVAKSPRKEEKLPELRPGNIRRGSVPISPRKVLAEDMSSSGEKQLRPGVIKKGT